MTFCYHLFIFHIFTYLFLFLRVIDYFRSRLQVLFLTEISRYAFILDQFNLSSCEF